MSATNEPTMDGAGTSEPAGRSTDGAVWIVDGANVVGSRPDGWWRDRPGAAGRLYARLSATFGEPGPARPGLGASGGLERVAGGRGGSDSRGGSGSGGRDSDSGGDGGGGDGGGGHPIGGGGDPGGGPAAGAGTDTPAPARIVLVLEGAARAGVPAGPGPGPLRVIHAPGSGDDTIVEQARAAAEAVPGGGRAVLVVTADRGLRARIAALGVHAVGPGWLWERLSPPAG